MWRALFGAVNAPDDLLRRLGVRAVRFDPGGLKEEAVEGPTYLAVSKEVRGVSGRYFRGTRETCPARRARDPGSARRLWREGTELTDLR